MPLTRDNKPIKPGQIYHILCAGIREGGGWIMPRVIRAECKWVKNNRANFKTTESDENALLNLVHDHVFKEKRAANRVAARLIRSHISDLADSLMEAKMELDKVKP